ncbi:MAG: hypothetical protein K4H23_04650 [Mollicutes bacterium PWAP]|nr:hypothetical protein [Mollicutes bacterium PWAP]
MIKYINFKKLNKNSLIDGETMRVELSKGTNIFIGPKGGGKSTLFDLISLINERKISKSVIDAFESHDLKFVSVETFQGEIIGVQNLLNISKKNMELEFLKMNYLVSQNDIIKKSLDDEKKVESKKNVYANEFVNKNDEIKSLFKNIKDFREILSNFATLYSSKINWENIMKLSEKKHNKEDFYNINIDFRNLIDKNISKINSLKELKSIAEKTFNTYGRIISSDDNLLSEKDFQDFSKEQKNIINSSLKIIAITNKAIKELDKQNYYRKLFKQIFDKKITKISESKEDEEKKKDIENNFKENSLKHMSDLAKKIKKGNNQLYNLFNEEKTLIFKNYSNYDDMINFKVDYKIQNDYDFIYSLVKTCVHASKRGGSSDLYSWVLTNIDNTVKDANQNNFYKKIAKMIVKKSEIKLVINGQDYESLSAGQKSIIGIKYKLDKSSHDNLFLDQPEDHLDNKTIYNELRPIINEFMGQKIIVTHNANIGLLTEVENVVICNLYSENKYRKGTIIEKNNYSDAADYLEGGFNAITSRTNILKGKK